MTNSPALHPGSAFSVSDGSPIILPILVRPEQPRNIGSVVRACANFNIPVLAIVQATPFTPDDERQIRVASAGAWDHVRVEIFPTIPSAAAPCDTIAALHGKHRSGHGAPLTPQHFFESLPTPHTSAALLFGPESTGLTLADLTYAHDTITIPTAPHFPSMNLSHAVATALYEFRLSQSVNLPDSPPVHLPVEPPAPTAAREQFLSRLESLLGPSTTPHVSLDKWRAILHKAQVTEEEICTLYNTLKKLTRR